MQIIDWLLGDDIVIQQLTNKHFRDRFFNRGNEGYMAKYLDLYDAAKEERGAIIYFDKWTSSAYTLLELKYMDAHHDHPYYQDATKKVPNDLWDIHGKAPKTGYQDICTSKIYDAKPAG